MEWEVVLTEWKNNKVSLYSTGNYIQYPMINHNKRILKGYNFNNNDHIYTYN